jgi:hypothetical protein
MHVTHAVLANEINLGIDTPHREFLVLSAAQEKKEEDSVVESSESSDAEKSKV